MRKVGDEAAEESCGGVGIAPRMDLQIDVARGAVDGHEGVAPAPLQGGQVLEIDVNEADGRLLEDTDRGLVGLRSSAETMALETAVYSTAGELGVDAASHHFGDVVERQLQLGSQFADQRLFERRQTGRQGLRGMRAVVDGRAFAPPADRRLADPQLDRQVGDRFPAALNVSPDLRCGRGVGVQAQLHDARRSLIYEMPRSTPIPSNQSSGTKHYRGGGLPTSATRISSFDASPARSTVPRASTMADEPNETRSAVRPATSARTIITALSLARAISTALLKATTSARSGGRLLLLGTKIALAPRATMSVASLG